VEIGSPAWRRLIEDGAATAGITVCPAQTALFARHAEALLAWNRTTNLTTVTAPEAVAVKHFLDAVIPVRYVPAGSTVLDIGSGGGFPGIPLKIMNPSISLTLIDSVRKKVSFLQYLIRILSLEDARARHVRAQELATLPDVVNGFDVIVCRALTALADFIRMARPLLNAGGVMIAMKGNISDEELGEAMILAGDEAAAEKMSIDTIRYTLPVLDLPRQICLVRLQRNRC